MISGGINVKLKCEQSGFVSKSDVQACADYVTERFKEAVRVECADVYGEKVIEGTSVKYKDACSKRFGSSIWEDPTQVYKGYLSFKKRIESEGLEGKRIDTFLEDQIIAYARKRQKPRLQLRTGPTFGFEGTANSPIQGICCPPIFFTEGDNNALTRSRDNISCGEKMPLHSKD